MTVLRLAAVLLLLPVVASGQTEVSICDVQQYDANGLTPLVGQYVTVTGIVTAPPGIFLPYYTSFYIELDGCGLCVFGFDPPYGVPVLGDSVRVTGDVVEYISSSTGAGATTEIVLGFFEVLSTGNADPIPSDMDIEDLQVEENEGRFLRAIGTVISTSLPWELDISDGGAPLTIYGAGAQLDLSGFEIGDAMRVAGVLSQYDRTVPFLGDYELMPRYQSDIEEWTVSPVTETSWGCIKALYRE